MRAAVGTSRNQDRFWLLGQLVESARRSRIEVKETGVRVLRDGSVQFKEIEFTAEFDRVCAAPQSRVIAEQHCLLIVSLREKVRAQNC